MEGRLRSAKIRRRVGGLPIHGNGALTRLRPADDMSADAAAAFRHITASTAPGHFVEADRDLLHRYCQAIADARQADRELASGGFVVGGKPSAWLQVQREANKAIATLATRLRLSPQSRIIPRQQEAECRAVRRRFIICLASMTRSLGVANNPVITDEMILRVANIVRDYGRG